MENFSDIPSPKRGRPRKYPEGLDKMNFGTAKTRRGQQNYVATLDAYSFLRGYQQRCGQTLFSYLLEGEKRKTILAELGRMDSERPGEQLRVLQTALKICNEKMPTAMAIGFIRKTRGLGHPPGAAALHDAILRTIKDYRALHKSVSDEDVERALETNLTLFKDNQIKLPI